LTAGGQTFTVTQADGCNASTTLFPTSANPPASGATGLTFQVQTTAGCSWTAVSNAAWITITAGSAGTGNGTVTYDVAANPSPARVGTITAGGQTFTVNQADGCAANTSLVPSSANHPASGASSQAFQIQTGAGCPWTAVSNASWITLTSSGSGSGPASVVYNIAANPGPARNGTVTAAGLTFTVNQADGCTLNTTLLPTGASQPAAGATGQGFQVQAAVGCSWTAVSNAAWITITAGAAGSGPGGVTYDVAANSGPARNGTITAGGQTFTVTQADGCLANTTLAPTSASPPSAGATGSTFQVQTAAGCAWTAVSNAAWITITAGSSGTGPGTVTYNVAANVGPDRTGTLTAAGKTFTVTQTDGCNANSTLTPASSSPPAEGAAGLAFQVQTAPSCAWTAVSNVAWITITAGASGTGPGTVAYSVAANAGPARTGTITAAGQTFTVNQPNTCTSGTVLSPGSATIPAAGATGQSFQIQTFAACPWTAVSNTPWISITSATAGTGPGTITFDVASNPGLGRTGTITAAGQTFSVIQGEGCQAGAALTPASSSAPAAGATGQVLNLSIAEGCPWTASALDPWITLTSETSGAGNATLRFSVDRNTGRARSGRISAAGLFHTVNQEDGCAEGTTLSSPGASVPAAGAVGQSFSIAASPDCSWTAVSNAAWISILSGTPGSGAGTIVYSVAANAGPERSGTITAGGKTFTITQADSCTAGATLNPSSASVPVAGASGLTFQVATSAACPWMAVAEDPWITITAGASGTGNGTVTFSVAPNDGPDRTGTITVAGTAFTINQAPGCFTPAVPRISSHPVAPVLAGNSFTVAWDPVLDLPSTGFYRLHIANNAACASPVSSTTTGLSVTVPTEPGKVVTYCIQIQSVAGGICPPANTSPLSEPVRVEVRPLPASFTVIQGQLPAARTNVNGPPPSGSTVVFRNIGESAGTLTLSATGGFFSIARQNVLEVAAGTDLEVGLLFTTANTTVEGIQNGELTGTWSVAGEALSVSTPITLTVLAGSSQPTGGMKLEPVGSATITFSLPAEPASVRFGQNVLNPAPQDVLIRNTGSLPVRISPTIGPGGTWLSISGDFTTPIPAYTERTFTLSVDRSRRTSEEGAPPLSTILRIENVDGNPDDAAVFEVIDEEPPPPVSGTNRAELLDTEYSLIVGSSVSTSSSPAGGKSWLFGAPENTQYQSDGWIRNRSSDQISVDLYYTPDSAQGLTDPGVKKNTVTLDGYRSYRLSDFVKSLFAENGSGLVEVRSRQLPQLSIRQIVDSVTIRNGIPYNNGAEFPLVVSGEGVSAQGSAGTGDRIILSGMKGPKAGFRTNLIFSETIGKPVAVRARLYGTDGRKLGEKKVAINPYSKTQVNGGDPELFPIPYDNATVVVEPLSGEGFVSVVATVIDNASGSYFIRLGTVSARPAQATRTSKAVTSGFLPVVSREESPDTFYTTRLSVTNASESDATINVTFLPEKGYGVPSEPVTVVVPKKESGEGEDGPKSVTFGNVLEELLGIQSNARGMLKIEGELESLVFATETSTPLDKTDPEAGRSLSSFNLAPGSDAKFAGAFSINSPEVTGIRQTESDTAKAEVSVPAIEEGSQYRTNLILAELAGEKGKVKVILRKPGGAALGEPLVVELAPFERKQIDRVITTIVKPPSGTGEYKDIEIIVQALEGKAKSIALVSRVASDPKSRRLDTYVLGPSTSGSAKKAKK
ncbi:MAG: BACON domain-containing protein, partial [Acidobacteria bacterium]|nr:BACON domain-containing protein [Acidobacteriota bacterium]